MVIDVRAAQRFADVKTIVGPKRPDANVCWCLSYRIPAKENQSLVGAERVKRLLRQQFPPSVLAYDGDEVVGCRLSWPRALPPSRRSPTPTRC
ncbi:hypothetical protein [Pseudoclavibacter sp. AY1F1]|uniref:hypothetical protein n=1 Tax=Pseudoclavibacter sp. AY1F1 TaxID=2080583 RepID=UPI001CA5A71B